MNSNELEKEMNSNELEKEMNSNELEKEVIEFILWLTPCGEVTPAPTLELIGHEARKLNRKIIKHLNANKPLQSQ